MKLRSRIGMIAKRLIMKNPDEIRVHSIFENAMNLIAEEDYIITILPIGYSEGPLNILLDRKDFLDLKALGIPIGGYLPIRDFMDWTALEDSDCVLRSLNRNNPDHIIRKNVSDMSQYRNPGQLEKRYVLQCCKAEEGITLKDPKMLSEALMPMLGYGQGLTPSGDDFIYGMLAVLFYDCACRNEDQDWLEKAAEYIAAAAKSKTTIISFNMLRTCKEAAFLQWVQDLLKAVFCEGSAETRKAAQKVVQIGSSSGKDMILGMIYGMNNIGYKEGLHGFQEFGKEKCIL